MKHESVVGTRLPKGLVQDLEQIEPDGVANFPGSGKTTPIHGHFVVDLGRNQNAFVERGKHVETANPGEGNERGGIRNDNHKPSRSNVRRSSSRSSAP